MLELTNPSMVSASICEEFLIPKLNLGIIQRETGPVEASFITEPQLYFVLMRSRSANARPFRQWVVNEVLPSIRKTGHYSIKGNTDITPQLANAKFVLEAAGIKGNQLAISLDNLVKAKTGESMLALTGVQLIAPQPKQLLTPTQLGKPLGLSAIKINQRLEELGLQRKTEAGWEPTEAGIAKGAIMLDTGKRHSSGVPIRQLKWPEDILRGSND